ncbi:MAG: class I SAM-dependent methyltransferase, partial [Candidatus Bathyarchaeia archaeon]
SFAIGKQRIHLIRADSHESYTLKRAKNILEGKYIDLLFIDGDHSYEGVKKDFIMYSSLVRKGGIVVFHDLLPLSRNREVNKFWEEIKSRFTYMEIINESPPKCGIGVLFFDSNEGKEIIQC